MAEVPMLTVVSLFSSLLVEQMGFFSYHQPFFPLKNFLFIFLISFDF